jgi:hypothetical protein
MPLAKITPGTTLREFPAGTFNSLVELAKLYQRDRASFATTPARDILPPSIKWRNDSGEDAPAGAIVRFTGALEIDNAVVLKGNKPDSTLSPFYGISFGPVADGALGDCTILDPVRARYDDEYEPTYGDTWGPEADEWHLRKGGDGFFVLGHPADDRVLVVQRQSGHLVAMPPCGKSIPARSGNTAGSAECCIFTLDDDTGVIAPVVNGDEPFRLRVFNIYGNSVAAKVPPNESYLAIHHERSGRWICERPPIPPGTSVTTEPEIPTCQGTAKWTWSESSWSLAEDGCGVEILTTTTPEPPDDFSNCLCPPRTTTTGEETTAAPTSTTSGFESLCQPVYPKFCGTDEGECTYTLCAINPPVPTIECLTTTTGGMTTSEPGTTTSCSPAGYQTLDPECECKYICTPSGWARHQDESSCPPWVSCPPPSEPCPLSGGSGGGPGGAACAGSGGGVGRILGVGCLENEFGQSDCSDGFGSGTEDNPCLEGCGQACYWFDPRTNEWALVSECGCVLCDPCGTPHNVACVAEKPSEPGSADGSTLVSVPCVPPCKTGSPISTTTTANPCGTTCKFQGDGSGGWTLLTSDCAGECHCAQPAFASHDVCERQVTPCVSGTTTTGPPTTSTAPPTTTTPPPDPFYCIQRGTNVAIDGDCLTGIGCEQLNASELSACLGSFDCQLCDGSFATVNECETSGCIVTTTTTSPPTTTTTTTPGPFYCVQHEALAASQGDCSTNISCEQGSLVLDACAGDPDCRICGGPYDTEEECEETCVTTTTCNPEATCGNACTIYCDTNSGAWTLAPICELIGDDGCQCDLLESEQNLLGTPCEFFTSFPVPCCNPCEGSVSPCGQRTTTTTPGP